MHNRLSSLNSFTAVALEYPKWCCVKVKNYKLNTKKFRLPGKLWSSTWLHNKDLLSDSLCRNIHSLLVHLLPWDRWKAVLQSLLLVFHLLLQFYCQCGNQEEQTNFLFPNLSVGRCLFPAKNNRKRKWNELKSFPLHEKRVHSPRDISQWHSNIWPPFHCFRTWICMMTAVKS